MKTEQGPTPAAKTATPVFCRCSRRRRRFTNGSSGNRKAAARPETIWRSAGWAEEVCRTFRVGFSPTSGEVSTRRATKEGFTDRELEEAGLLGAPDGQDVRPLSGTSHVPAGGPPRQSRWGSGGGRSRTRLPSTSTPPKGLCTRRGIFCTGSTRRRKAIADADEVVVVEGYTDVLGLVQAGVGNVVASMGTALTDAQIDLMMRFTSNVTFMFDADRAGTEAMLRSGELARGHSSAAHGGRAARRDGPRRRGRGRRQEAVAKCWPARYRCWGSSCGRLLARGDTSTARRPGTGLRGGRRGS